MTDANGASAAAPRQTKAVILVGGVSKATRFRPLSLDLPKPLFPIAGRAMIQHSCDALAMVPGLCEIILLGFFEEQLFEGFLSTMSETHNIPFRYLKEETESGTAGGLYRYRDVILQGDPAAVFVLHCDIGCSFPLAQLLDFHHATAGSDCTVLGKELEDTAHQYGEMVVDTKSSELLHYAARPQSDISTVVNAGIYVFSPAMFDHLARVGDDINRGSTYRPYFPAHEAQKLAIEQDILMSLAGRGRIYVFDCGQDFWVQIKDAAGALRCSGEYLEYFVAEKPELLAKASAGMRAKVGRLGSAGSFAGSVGVGSSKLTIVGAVIIDGSAKVHPSAKIGPNVVLGPGVSVGPGCRLKDCIILEDCQVSDHAVVSGAIVGWQSSIGHWSRVQGTVLNPSILGAGVNVQPEIIVASCTVLPHKILTENCHNRIIL